MKFLAGASRKHRWIKWLPGTKHFSLKPYIFGFLLKENTRLFSFPIVTINCSRINILCSKNVNNTVNYKLHQHREILQSHAGSDKGIGATG
jgi:hypothetical protein